jgi:two-component system, chemotaxis family, chemotaxis protein CheY
VVDDDETIRESLTVILELDGYEVRAAENGAVALGLMETNCPHVVLLDMRMPVMDGWAFAREARARGYELRILVMTAAQDAADWAQQVAADGVLAKPFAVADLLREVERLCAA